MSKENLESVNNVKRDVVSEVNNEKPRMTTGYLVRVALFAAIAFIVMFAEFPIGTLFPPYLKVDLSEIIVFIGGMIMGPAAIVLIEIVKNSLNLMLKSSTGGVGELANFTVGVALLLPTVMILRKKTTVVRAVIGFSLGILVMIFVAAIGNYFVFLPLYGVPAESRMGMIIPILVPFNALKGIIIAVLGTALHFSIKGVYKHLR